MRFRWGSVSLLELSYFQLFVRHVIKIHFLALEMFCYCIRIHAKRERFQLFNCLLFGKHFVVGFLKFNAFCFQCKGCKLRIYITKILNSWTLSVFVIALLALAWWWVRWCLGTTQGYSVCALVVVISFIRDDVTIFTLASYVMILSCSIWPSQRRGYEYVCLPR